VLLTSGGNSDSRGENQGFRTVLASRMSLTGAPNGAHLLARTRSFRPSLQFRTTRTSPGSAFCSRAFMKRKC
jgi:hypothetical protein